MRPDWLFDTSALTPHGFCLTWEPGLLWLDAGSDAVIALSYCSIPLAVLYFVRRRSNLAYGWMALLFAAFIVACGATHVMDIVTLWVPAYNAQVAAKLVTAVLSVATAISVWPLVPKLLAVPSPNDLERANIALRNTQRELEEQNNSLEQRVAERTEQLQAFATMSADWFWEQDADFRYRADANIPFMTGTNDAGKTRWELADPLMGTSKNPLSFRL